MYFTLKLMIMPCRPLLYLVIALLLISCASEGKTEGQDATSEAATNEFATFSSFDGEQIAYFDEGEGPAVMLLHGFINSAASWEGTELKKQLRAQGFRIIVPDLRGNGNSAKPQTDAGYADFAEIKDLLALADHLELEEYMAVGYSRGSILLANLLTKEPRISRAVIGGMGLDFTNPDWPRRIQFADAFSGEVALTPETEGAVNYAKSINADLRSLHLQQKHQPSTSPDALREVSIPIMVLVGNDDKDNGDPGQLERLFPNGRLNIIPGDHNTTYRKGVFAAATMAFLKTGEKMAE